MKIAVISYLFEGAHSRGVIRGESNSEKFQNLGPPLKLRINYSRTRFVGQVGLITIRGEASDDFQPPPGVVGRRRAREGERLDAARV